MILGNSYRRGFVFLFYFDGLFVKKPYHRHLNISHVPVLNKLIRTECFFDYLLPVLSADAEYFYWLRKKVVQNLCSTPCIISYAFTRFLIRYEITVRYKVYVDNWGYVKKINELRLTSSWFCTFTVALQIRDRTTNFVLKCICKLLRGLDMFCGTEKSNLYDYDKNTFV